MCCLCCVPSALRVTSDSIPLRHHRTVDASRFPWDTWRPIQLFQVIPGSCLPTYGCTAQSWLYCGPEQVYLPFIVLYSVLLVQRDTSSGIIILEASATAHSARLGCSFYVQAYLSRLTSTSLVHTKAHRVGRRPAPPEVELCRICLVQITQSGVLTQPEVWSFVLGAAKP